MAVLRAGNEADYLFRVGDYSRNELKVVHFSGSEAISELFQFHVDLASTNEALDFDRIIGQPGLLTLHSPGGRRYVHGLVNLFEQTGREGRWTYYHARIVPALRLLAHRATCRIFQDQSIPDILQQVLTDGGLVSDQFRFSLSRSYSPREYCVQYRETDLAFLRRLMEEQGIFYFFEHTDDKHVLVIGDDPAIHVPIAEPATILYRAPGTAGVSAEEHISDYRYNREIRSGAVRLRDFDFKRPSLNLEQERTVEGDGHLEMYDFPGRYLTADEGEDLARVRLETFQTTERIGSGQSDCSRIAAGWRFTLAGHYRTDFNREYLVIRTSHSGSQPQVLGPEAAGAGGTAYQNHFQCIPSDVPFHPAPATPKPIIHGPQTAMVVGPEGEEIYTDEYGRVKVQFHWDRVGERNERSSCWVRVKQAWAGANWGALFLPRIGHEVVVEFMEGDPDRPLVTGSVYNGENMPPYPLPDEKTKSTIKSNSSTGGEGSNEIRFEDKKGEEEVYLHAQKNLTTAVEADESRSVGANRSTTIGKDDTLEVKGKRIETVHVDRNVNIKGHHTVDIDNGHETVVIHTGNRTVDVNTGHETLNVKTGNRTVNVNAGHDTLNVITGHQAVNVNGGHSTLNVTTGNRDINVPAGAYQLAADRIAASGSSKIIIDSPDIEMGSGTIKINGSTIELSVGGNSIKIESSKITLSGGSGSIVLDAVGVTVTGAMIKLN